MGDEWIAKAQNDLGSIIKAPKLTEKLLKKPPFRFLHDCVTGFIKATGFPKDYFSADELDSSKVTDKEAKINFLAKVFKLIDSAGVGDPVAAKPNVVVTGAEPENTGDFLIKLAACAALSEDQRSAAVKKALGGGGEEEKPAKAKKDPPPAAKKESPPPEPAPKKEEEKPKPKEEKPKREAPKKEESESSSGAVPAVAPLQPAPQQDAGARPGTATARKPPPALKSNEVVEDRADIKAGPNAAVILETKDKDEEKQDERDWQAVVDEEEQAAARAREAKTSDTGAKGYLGRQAQEAMKEQEKKEQEEREAAEAAGRSSTGIVLNTRRRTDKAGGGMGENEMTKLREQLQLLTKATNPLGKFLEAIHEDVDTMSRELEMWRTEARTQAVAATEAQRQTEESLHEIHGKLQTVEDQISDQIMKINILRQTILNNDNTVETLLRMVVNPEVGGSKKK